MSDRKKLPSISDLPKKEYPVRVLQFGSGNFLRAFADWIIQKANDRIGFNTGVAVVQSISKNTTLARQNGSFTVNIRGYKNSRTISIADKVDAIQRIVNGNILADLEKEAANPNLEIIISNTTETGITFDPSDTSASTISKTFPGKLTQVLFKRYRVYPEKNVAIIPCELIEKNGSVLKECVIKYSRHWNLGLKFEDYIQNKIHFCHTLVDRIVTGTPENISRLQNDLGYEDNAIVTCEPYYLWVIEASPWVQKAFPLDKAGLNVIYTNNLEPYRNRKVRILNGMHTLMAPIGYLAGLQSVKDVMNHNTIGSFIKLVLKKEILPFLPGDRKINNLYSQEVIRRFLNPAINHNLIDITLYSFSKFKVRLFPSLTSFEKHYGYPPTGIALSLAALILLYRGIKDGEEIPLQDNPRLIEIMKTLWGKTQYTEVGLQQLVETVLKDKFIWNNEFAVSKKFSEKTALYLYWIDQYGIIEALNKAQREITDFSKVTS
ncbi:MAG: altronate oxidoreductase [Cyclobacteriaceae bacterium]|nr:MAG: altronate oxidoreductase [Cyclobacteriaceae bacterium]